MIYKAFHNQVLPTAFAAHFSCLQICLNQTHNLLSRCPPTFAFPCIPKPLAMSLCFTSSQEKALHFPDLLGASFPHTPVYAMLPSIVALGYSSRHRNISWERLVEISYPFKVFKWVTVSTINKQITGFFPFEFQFSKSMLKPIKFMNIFHLYRHILEILGTRL